MQTKHIHLLQQLIQCKSITPTDAGALLLLRKYLEELGFSCHIKEFGGKNSVLNMYAVKKCNSAKNLCFAGHTDVVPPGDVSKWTYNPFEAVIKDDILYGRGAVDMKSAIVAFIAAAEHLMTTSNRYNISLLLTADEEGQAVYGTKPMLEWIYDVLGGKIDHCIVGEPVSKKFIGDTIKIGARGSATFVIKIRGKQGHVAYHHLADNPVKKANLFLDQLLKYNFQHKNELFNKTNLEVTKVLCDSGAENVIPNEILIQFNIRYGNDYSYKSLKKLIENILSQNFSQQNEYEITSWSSGDAFTGIDRDAEFLKLIESSIEKVNGVKPIVDTAGGTSDARFIKKYCDVLEIGLLGDTAHKVDEQVSLQDIENLTKVYLKVLQSYIS